MDSGDGNKLKAVDESGFPILIGEVRGDLRAYKVGAGTDYRDAFASGLTSNDALFVPPGRTWLVSKPTMGALTGIQLQDKKSLFSEELTLDQMTNATVGAIIQPTGSPWGTGSAVVELLGSLASIVNIQVDGLNIVQTALKISGAQCAGVGFTARGGTTEALLLLGDKTRLVNFLVKSGGQYALHQTSGADLLVDTALILNGTIAALDVAGNVGKWGNVRVGGADASTRAMRLAGTKHEFTGLFVDGAPQSIRVAGPHHQLVSVRFHGNGFQLTGHAFLKGAVEVDGTVDCQGLLLDDFELVPVQTMTALQIGICDTDPANQKITNIRDVGLHAASVQNLQDMVNLPICIRDGNGDGSDFTGYVTAFNSGDNSLSLNAPLTGPAKPDTPYVIKGWKYVVDFLAGDFQATNAARCVLGHGAAHHCTSQLWNPSMQRPAGVGLIMQTGRASEAVGTGSFAGGITSASPNHNCINSPSIVLPIPTTLPQALAVTVKGPRTITVVRAASPQPNNFEYVAKL